MARKTSDSTRRGATSLFVTLVAASVLAVPAVASAAQPGGADASGERVGSGQRGATASAVLFDDRNFSDNGPSQGVAGPGCQNVARPKVTSSIRTSNKLKVWAGRNCSGASKVINGDIANLATIGFDNRIVSLRFL
ncbi:hypothetical protein GPA10_17015 [Streptomyces sp. p1417]|uniref:Beta/Gamma crystallin n=1 Tax=Streptomyces typhae TaxID=2681492 RepID=A0A6L6WY31_9ACTN|nr:hypothetical protein [Streptomyces typhae]MVO86415.1 hypothetical protein [Streptomyces typhae]